ncbi:hypothetical protein [Mucilaginibacter aquariorum]|uniref:Chemotaxis methyl-accepting receptor HlyB-like 4HB MCP domain-containing protein n=1 Tax=Mucilaginibacter aquariorum TaxID=2967225 RepID=A0ABT1T283_9SPHI|nr:hypothetical protein [Mucilaginibacter aquariorum]MCQ6958721.1 hypothetical protein [Mucilaginibacter aquariorum]
MNNIKHSRNLTLGGSLTALGLVILLLVMTVVGTDTQKYLTGQINKQQQVHERLRDLARSVGLLDILHLRYRTSGMILFRIGYDQITDSVDLQLKDLKDLVKKDAAGAVLWRSVVAGIDTAQRYWRMEEQRSHVKRPAQFAEEEEKRLDVVRFAVSAFDDHTRLQLKGLQDRLEKLQLQMRSWFILLQAVIAIILLIVSLRAGLTRISGANDSRHGHASE